MHPNSLKNLIPLNQRSSEEKSRIGSMGGKTYTKKRYDSNMIVQSGRAKCKNCRVQCPFKKPNMLEDIDMFCTIPEARAKAVIYKMPVMNGNVLEKMSYSVLDDMAKMSKDPREKKMLHDMMLNHKKEFYPNVQKSVNLNVAVETTSSKVLDNLFKEFGDDDGVVDVEVGE